MFSILDIFVKDMENYYEVKYMKFSIKMKR